MFLQSFAGAADCVLAHSPHCSNLLDSIMFFRNGAHACMMPTHNEESQGTLGQRLCVLAVSCIPVNPGNLGSLVNRGINNLRVINTRLWFKSTPRNHLRIWGTTGVVPNSKSLDRGCFGPQILQGNFLCPILQLAFDRGWQDNICYPAIGSALGLFKC